MLRLSIISLAVAALVGCSTVRPLGDINIKDDPKVSSTIVRELDKMPAPEGAPIPVAVYGFKDMTG